MQNRRVHPVPLLPLLLIYGGTCAAAIGTVALTSFWRGYPLLTGSLLAALVAAGPLLAATHRRRRLRPEFLAERPDRRRLRYHGPTAASPPADAPLARPIRSVVLVAFVLSLATWFVPGFPVLCTILAAYALRTPAPDGESAGRDMAWAAIGVGVVTMGLQLWALLTIIY